MRDRPDSKPSKDAPAPNWVEGNVVNPFLNSFLVTPYNAAANAVNFVAQTDVMDKKDVLPTADMEFMSGNWFAQNISGGLGAIVPYAVAGKVAGAGMRGLGNKMAAESSAAVFLKNDIAAQVVGAAALDFARDTRPGETHLGNMVGGAAAFYVFGKGNALVQPESFWLRQGARAGIGATGGIANITAASLASGEGLPGLRALGEAAVAGGTMNVALPPLQKALTPSEMQSAYYNAKWHAKDAYHDARRAGYALLNRYDMRHPIDKLSNWMSGDDALHSAQRVPLTEQNNPVRDFERAAPEYLKTIQGQENLLEQTADRKQQYDICDGMKEARIGFGEKLLQIWHGTADKPGMKSYSDAELATTAGVTPDRVKQIRELLSENLHARDAEGAGFSTKLFDLMGMNCDTIGAHSDRYALNEISYSRERFWGYNENELSTRMNMSRVHHFQDHHPRTPLEWMPFEPTAQLPNLFHGTMSPSLASIMAERAMLPAWEMRLRGIQQRTGESANEVYPRRSISLTRDFNEAFVYHRHSPQHLTDFPMVLGVSRDVVPRARMADLVEPGEILTNRLRFGDSAFGWHKSDVKNIYVPDAEVSNVTQQLANRRIRGVEVVGLSELPSPQWKPEPTIAELQEMYNGAVW